MLFFGFLLFLILIFVFALLYFACILIRARFSYLNKNFPGMTLRNPIFGNVFESEEVSFFEEWKRKIRLYGPVYKYYTFFGQPWLCVADPESIRHILISNSKNYVRGPLTGVEIFCKIVGKTSMLVTDGNVHRKHRAVTSPAFKFSNIKKLVPTVQVSSEKLIDHWSSLISESSHCKLDKINIRREMSRVTLSAIGSAGFGFDFDCIGNESPVVKALEQTIGLEEERKFWHFFPFVEYLPTPRARDMWSGIKQLQKIFYEMIQARKQNLSYDNLTREKNLLDMILESNSDLNLKHRLTNKELQDELMTFILAGHETSSLTLTYTFWLLCTHIDVQEKCRKEIEKELADEILTWDSFSRLAYTKAVVCETLRLYPPIPMISRTSLSPDHFYGKDILSNTAIGILIASMHRLPEVWGSEADSFIPERFLEDSVPWDAWMPFGEGNHKCLGYQFALMEITLVLSMLLKRFRFTMAEEDTKVRLQIMVTLQPADPVLVTVQPV